MNKIKIIITSFLLICMPVISDTTQNKSYTNICRKCQSQYVGPRVNGKKHGRYRKNFEPAIYWWKKPKGVTTKGDYIGLVGEWKSGKPIGSFFVYTKKEPAKKKREKYSTLVSPSNQTYYKQKKLFQVTKPPWKSKYIVPSCCFSKKLIR